jgi:hypothetical protein
MNAWAQDLNLLGKRRWIPPPPSASTDCTALLSIIRLHCCLFKQTIMNLLHY